MRKRKFKKSILSAALISTVLTVHVQLTAASDVQPVGASKINFSDATKHWAESSIETAVSKGYVDGYPDGTFKPDKSISRAEFLKMVVSGMKLPTESAESGDNWYKSYLNAAVLSGIHRYDDFNQDINGAISRKEMTRIIVRATNKDLQKPDSVVDDKSLVYEAVSKGLLQGLNGGELGLDQDTTRAQAITVIERILNINNGVVLSQDTAALSYAEVALTGSNMGTMYNAQVKKLPMEINVGGLQAYINEIIVVDMTDPSSAYYDWFKDAKKANKQPMGDDYLVGLHITIHNDEPQPGKYVSVNQSLDIVNYLRCEMPADSSSPVKSFPLIRLDNIVDYDGWFIGTIGKSVVQESLTKYGASYPILARVNASGTYRLGEGKLQQ